MENDGGYKLELPINQIVCGDCLETMRTFPDDCIDLVMFSPPYWGLRDYGVKGQLGLEPHPNMYVAHMVEVCREVKRVLKKSGSMYIVLGDTYCGGGTHHGKWKESGKHRLKKGNDYMSSEEPQASSNLGMDGKWLQPKQKLLIPARVAIALQEDGWILRNNIIWNKPNHMPSSVKDRLTNAYEHIFFFAKSRRYYYDLDAIREPHTSIPDLKNKERTKKRGPTQADLTPHGPYAKATHDRVKSMHNKGKNPGDIVSERVVANLEHFRSKGSGGHFDFGGLDSKEAKHEHIGGKNPADFWSINTQPFKGAHFAVYPETICKRPIKASCPAQICKKCGKPQSRIVKKNLTDTEGWGKATKQHTTIPISTIRNGKGRMGTSKIETLGWSKCSCDAGFEAGIVLDPMCGSGTTCVVAQKLGRRWIGIELNPEYVEIAKKRLSNCSQKLSSFSCG